MIADYYDDNGKRFIRLFHFFDCSIQTRITSVRNKIVWYCKSILKQMQGRQRRPSPWGHDAFRPCIRFAPYFLKNFWLCLRKFYLLFTYFLCTLFPPYFDHDAFMHHPMHVLDAPDRVSIEVSENRLSLILLQISFVSAAFGRWCLVAYNTRVLLLHLKFGQRRKRNLSNENTHTNIMRLIMRYKTAAETKNKCRGSWGKSGLFYFCNELKLVDY